MSAFSDFFTAEPEYEEMVNETETFLPPDNGTMELTTVAATDPYTMDARISPLGLNLKWPSLNRFILIVALSVIGIFSNLFYVSSFLADKAIKKGTNAFLWFGGVFDLTSVLLCMGMAFLALVSNEIGLPAELDKCNYVKSIVVTTNDAHMILHLITASDKYTRLRNTEHRVYKTSYFQLVLITVMVTAASAGDAIIGAVYELDYDFCRRRHTGNIYYRATTAIIFYVIPFLVTSYLLIYTYCRIYRRAFLPRYKRSTSYEYDRNEILLAIRIYFSHILFWLPYIAVLYQPDVTDVVFYSFAWMGYLRTLFAGIINNLLSPVLRKASRSTIRYALCKRSSRPRHRCMGGGRGSGGVHVHHLSESPVNSPGLAHAQRAQAQALYESTAGWTCPRWCPDCRNTPPTGRRGRSMRRRQSEPPRVRSVTWGSDPSVYETPV